VAAGRVPAATNARSPLWAAPGCAARVRLSRRDQHDRDEARTIKNLAIDLVGYRNVHPSGVTFDVLAFHQDSLKAGMDNKGGVASAFIPLRVRYETPEMFVEAGAGWGITGGQVTASSSTEVNGETVQMWSETIDGEGLPEITRVIADVEAGLHIDRWSASARIARAFFPTFDGNLAREARRLQLPSPRVRRRAGGRDDDQ